MDLRDQEFDIEHSAEVMCLCEGSVPGVVVADGEGGERIKLEFNAAYASKIFADDDRIMRPYFPGLNS